MPVEYQVPGVYIEEFSSGSRPIQGVSTAVAAFLGCTYTRPKGNRGQPIAVYSWNQFIEDFCTIRYFIKGQDADGNEKEQERAQPDISIFPEGAYLPLSVYGYFQNGGTRCYVESLSVQEDQEKAPQLAVKKDAEPSIALKPGYKPREVSLRFKSTPILQDSQASQGPSGASNTAAGQDPTNSGGAATGQNQPGGTPKPKEEKLTVEIIVGDTVRETFEKTVSIGKRAPLKTDFANWLAASKIIDVLDADQAASILDDTTPDVIYAGFARPRDQPITSSEPFRGNVTQRTGLGALEEISDVTMLICPDLMSVYDGMAKQSKADEAALAVALVQNEMLGHCARMKDRFAILDSLPGQEITQMVAWRKQGANYSKDDGKYGALYYPWIEIANPNARGGSKQTILVPPSGHLAGVYARVDQERGVHKAPANESIRGAIGLEKRVIDSEQESLNPISVNCIRAFPNRGVVVWGARTLAEASSEWRYINVRRLFNFVEKSIYESTQWVVFEPNDMDTWERVKRTITEFLTRVWRSGALFGATPEQAFYVKCDADLNTKAVRDAGQLIVEIGIAPVKPAEFVIFRFTQKEDGGNISE